MLHLPSNPTGEEVTLALLPPTPSMRRVTGDYLLKARHHGRAIGRDALLEALATSVRPLPATVSITFWPTQGASRTGREEYLPGKYKPQGTTWTGTLRQQADWMRAYTNISVHEKSKRRCLAHGTSLYSGSSDAECTGITELFGDNDAGDPRGPIERAMRAAGLAYIIQERASKWHNHCALASPLIPQGAGWKESWWLPRYGWTLGILSEIGEFSCSLTHPKKGTPSVSYMGFDATTDRLLALCYVSHRSVQSDPVPTTTFQDGGSLDFEHFLQATGFAEIPKSERPPRQRNVWVGGLKLEHGDNRLFRAFDAAGLIDRPMPNGTGYYVECPWHHLHSSGPKRGSTGTFIDRTFYCHHRCRSLHKFTDLREALPPHASAILFAPRKVTERAVDAPKLFTPAEMRADIVPRFIRPSAGLYMVHAETGIGKTQAFIDIAIARYNAAYAGREPGERHADHSTTWILVPTHEIAQQLYAAFGARGFESVRYVRSPLAVRDPAGGGYACAIRSQGRALASGGQYPYKTLCLDGGRGQCEYWNGCYARTNLVLGPGNAHVTIAVHANLHAIGRASTTTLVVLDEAYDPIKTVSWDLAKLDHAIAGLGAFDPAYVDAMRPALDKMRYDLARVTAAEPKVDVPPTPLCDWLGTSAVQSVLGARTEEDTGQPPRIERMHLNRARRNLTLATDIGRSSEALDAVERAVRMGRQGARAMDDGARAVPVLRIDCDEEEVEMHLTFPDLSLLSALDTAPTLVYLDANADLHRPLYESLVGPLTEGERYLRYPCGDGAPITRVIVEIKATRTLIVPKGEKLVLANAMPHLHILRDRILETRSKSVGLVTFKSLSTALLSCMPESTLTRDQVERIEAMPMAHRVQVESCGLRELVESCKVLSWTHGHYGDIRGSDRFKHVDHMISLGDPRPPMKATAFESAYLCLPEALRANRGSALASAEGEQVHGRLRAPWRTRPGHATHFGMVVPSGTGWAVREHRNGRGSAGGASLASVRASSDQVREYRASHGLSQRALASIVKVDQRYIAQVESSLVPASVELTAVVLAQVTVQILHGVTKS